jgi:contractile injection system tape measure protein
MSRAATHVIRRTSLEVTGPVQDDAFGFQREVTSWAHDRLLPELNQLFASLPEIREPVHIDRLQIDLNSTDIANWGNEVLAKLKSELFSILANRIRAEKAAADEQLNEQSTRGTSFLDKLAFYLETGVLPWSVAVTSRLALEEEMEHWLASREIGHLRPRVAELLRAGNARARFIASFSQAILRKTLTVFFEVPEKVWESLYVDSETLRLAELRLENLFSNFRREQLSILIALFRDFLEILAADGFVYSERTELEAVKSFLTRLVQERQIARRDLAFVRFHSSTFRLARQAVLEAESVSAMESQSVPLESSTADRDFAPMPVSSDVPASSYERERSKRKSPAVEGIFIQNAGLILLANFLPTLLDRVGLAGGGQLKDPGMAMVLMHYLACGEEGPSEFQVILPKVLCGWEIEKQIDLPRAVPDVMKDEARQLLESAIAHWDVLKATSPEALQEAFLCRAGKISLTPKNEWLLQVEQKPFDMLIQHLPWSFKLVKLPWMTRLLRTEWVE